MGLLRLLLAIAVLISHSTPIFGLVLTGPMTAVHAFFMISGFYISLVLQEKYFKLSHSYFLFFTNRLLRLFPPYWFLLLLIIILSFVQHYASRILDANGLDFGAFNIYFTFFPHMSFFTKFYLIFVNIFLIGQDTLLFLGLNMDTGNLFFTSHWQNTFPHLHSFLLIPVAWTISIEILFYMVAPFLVKKQIRWIIGLIGASLLLRICLIKYGFTSDQWEYRFFPTELAFFLLGNCSYRMYKILKQYSLKFRYLFFIFLMVLTLTFINNMIPIFQNGIVYLCVLFVSIPFIFILTKEWKIDRYIGELSYLVFITHSFFLSIITFLKIPYIYGDYFRNGLRLLIISVIFSVFIHEFLLKRIDTIRQKRLVVKN